MAEKSKNRLFRFIDEKSGLIGYARNDHGTVSAFIPGSYTQAYPFSERQAISEIAYDFAVVTGKDGKQGVINVLHDEVLVPTQYEAVTWQTVWTEMEAGKEMVMFLCRKENGTYDIISHPCAL